MAFSESTKKEINEIIFEENGFDFSINHQNLLIYGVPEYSEGYLINRILENLYGELEVKKFEYEIENYNKSTIELKQSNYHVEFNPSNSGSDRYALISIIKDFGRNQMVNMVLENSKTNYRTIVINKIDDLNYYCQASLRRNMEKYSNITNFILISNNLSKVTEPIRSRCCIITMGKLDNDINKKICKKLNCNYEENDLINILLNEEMSRLKLGDIQSLKDYVNNLLSLNKEKFNERLIRKVKSIIYNLYISNYPLDSVLLEINNYIMKNELSVEIKYLISKIIIESNININMGKRYLIHLENLIFGIFNILNKNKIII